MDEDHIDTFSFYLEELLVGQLEEVVHLVCFGIVKQKGQLLLVSLVSDYLLAGVKVGQFDGCAAYIGKGIKDDFCSIALTGDILGKGLRGDCRPRIFTYFDTLIKPFEKLIPFVPETVELILVILDHFFLFLFGGLFNHLFFEAIGVALDHDRTDFKQNVLAVGSH